MSDWLISLEGTSAGHQLALILALIAAASHAVFGALQKGRFDPWLTRGAIDASYAVMALPFALFVVPWPEPFMWPIFFVAWVIHLFYKYFQARAYEKGAFTVVYPVVRGTGPLVTIIAAGIVFGESYGPVQWLGVACLTGGIFCLAGFNIAKETIDKKSLYQALTLALITGLTVAAYTTFDAYGIRATADPFTFLAWFFLIDGLVFPIIALRRWRAMEDPPDPVALMQRGFIGGLIAYLSFGSIMLATRLDKVGEAAVLRETSTVFAAVIGWLFLKETVGFRRTALMAIIALGAVLVEAGG